jgi:hypothetical protein
MYCKVLWHVRLRSRRYLVTARPAAKEKALLGNGWPLNNVKAVFPMGSGPRLYPESHVAVREFGEWSCWNQEWSLEFESSEKKWVVRNRWQGMPEECCSGTQAEEPLPALCWVLLKCCKGCTLWYAVTVIVSRSNKSNCQSNTRLRSLTRDSIKAVCLVSISTCIWRAWGNSQN